VKNQIKNMMGHQDVELYNNYNLNFDNSLLFMPEWMEFYQDNQKLVLDTFPWAASVTANVFQVPKGGVAFGVHNAEHGATAILRPIWAYWERVSKSDHNQHVSFHTALDDQLTEDSQPLVIYEKSPPSVSNIGFMLRAMEGNPTIDKVRVDVALSAINSGLKSVMQVGRALSRELFPLLVADVRPK
jgi:hypothetical protein